MARGDKPALFAITPAIRDWVYRLAAREHITKNNVSRQTEIQVAINRHRNAWDTWVESKATLKVTRDAWQAAFNAFRESNGSGPTVASQLADLHAKEQELIAQQGAAFAAGNFEAAKEAFNAVQGILEQIREIEARTTNKDVTAAEAAKQTAQKKWKQAQSAETDARTAHLVTLATLLSLGGNLDEKAAKEYARVVKTPPADAVPAITESDATVGDGQFAISAIGEEDGDGEPETHSNAENDDARQSEAPSDGDHHQPPGDAGAPNE